MNNIILKALWKLGIQDRESLLSFTVLMVTAAMVSLVLLVISIIINKDYGQFVFIGAIYTYLATVAHKALN